MRNKMIKMTLGAAIGGIGGFTLGVDLDGAFKKRREDQRAENAKLVGMVLGEPDYAKVKRDIVASLKDVNHLSDIPLTVTKVLDSHGIPRETMIRVEAALKLHTSSQYPVPKPTGVNTYLNIIMGILLGMGITSMLD